jgi:hypothetical protein
MRALAVYISGRIKIGCPHHTLEASRQFNGSLAVLFRVRMIVTHTKP